MMESEAAIGNAVRIKGSIFIVSLEKCLPSVPPRRYEMCVFLQDKGWVQYPRIPFRIDRHDSIVLDPIG
jgi:hypothetical protein